MSARPQELTEANFAAAPVGADMTDHFLNAVFLIGLDPCFFIAELTEFVRELLVDFPNLDVLEEIKTFRWYYDRELGKKNLRASIRRWMANTKPRRKW